MLAAQVRATLWNLWVRGCEGREQCGTCSGDAGVTGCARMGRGRCSSAGVQTRASQFLPWLKSKPKGGCICLAQPSALSGHLLDKLLSCLLSGSPRHRRAPVRGMSWPHPVGSFLSVSSTLAMSPVCLAVHALSSAVVFALCRALLRQQPCARYEAPQRAITGIHGATRPSLVGVQNVSARNLHVLASWHT